MKTRVIELTEEKIQMIVQIICASATSLDDFCVLSYDYKMESLCNRCKDAISALLDDECDDYISQVIYSEVKDMLEEEW